MLVIGDELLDGRVVNSNATRVGRALAELGFGIAEVTTIPDDLTVIVRAAQEISARGTQLCLVSGGLGPTADDLTSAAFATLADRPLVRDETAASHIVAWLSARGRSVTPNQLKQADRPQGARLLVNPVGSAPGFDLTVLGCRFLSAPGIPAELDAMFTASIYTELAELGARTARRTLLTFGLIEAEVDQRLAAMPLRWPQVRVAFQVKFPEIHVVLTASVAHVADLDAAMAFAREALGVHLFATTPCRFAESVLATLQARGATLAIAESCTGGLISHLLTEVPGSSQTLLAGVVSYANAAKLEILGVPESVLAQHGAVFEATVLAMAEGVRRISHADYAVAASGVAGPSGGTPEKPVGTVYIAAIGATFAAARKLALPFDRSGNKLLSAYAALDLLRQHLLAVEPSPKSAEYP